MSKNKLAIIMALLAATLYAINVPFSKLLLEKISPTMLAGFLYLGAGIGMGIIMLIKRIAHIEQQAPLLEKNDLPFTIAMVVLDIAAPIFLMYGILYTSSANVSLLNNFEIVVTSLIALIIFKEKISKKLWVAIVLVTVGGIILGLESNGNFVFNKGSLFVLCACLCWGIENNCTRSISNKSSEEIVLIKGVFSGIGSIIVALIFKESFPSFLYIILAMLLGFVAYGLSINSYILAQKHIGAAKTSAFYSVAPFLGVGFSFLILGERPLLQFYIALIFMIVSTVIMIKDTLGNEKFFNRCTHSHEHRHGKNIHSHEHTHLFINLSHKHKHSH